MVDEIKQDNVIEPRYINDLKSWLSFNDRVLFEARRKSNPIIERINFLGIADSNLEEFIRTKFNSQKSLRKEIIKQTEDIESLFDDIKTELKEEYKINIVKVSELSENKKAYKSLKDHFKKQIFPMLQPLVLKSELPLPDMNDGGIFILTKIDDVARAATCILKIPPNKLIKVKYEENTFVTLDDIILQFISDFYRGVVVIWSKIFKVIRRVDSLRIDLDNNYIDSIKEQLSKRDKSETVLIEISSNIEGIKNICGNAKTRKRRYVSGLSFLKDIKDYISYNDDMVYNKTKPRMSLSLSNNDIFKTISDNDIMVHFPYESFDMSTVAFLEKAARDPNVVAIKQTLYRVSGDSPITKALIEAAKSGKQVSVLLELKAKFDENNNIRWAEQLSKSGCDIIFGPIHLKTHAKVSLVIRREGDTLAKYVNISTGNFNDKTARIYEDISIFMKDRKKFKIGDDACELFNYLGGLSRKVKTKELILSPNNFRKRILSEIDKCIEVEGSSITIKVNGLTDKKIIDKLYDASNAGVKINLIVRGMCCLIPGVVGLSENITVKSIVGRFLEHSRIFRFCYSENPTIFIGSADLMTRNLDHRVETTLPIKNKVILSQINELLDSYIKDNTNSHIMQSDCSYLIPEEVDGVEPFSIQNYLISKYKSLEKKIIR